MQKKGGEAGLGVFILKERIQVHPLWLKLGVFRKSCSKGLVKPRSTASRPRIFIHSLESVSTVSLIKRIDCGIHQYAHDVCSIAQLPALFEAMLV